MRKLKLKLPGWVKLWLILKKAEITFKYHSIMKPIRISDLKVGYKLYRINPANGKILEYKIEKIEGSWITISNEKGYICASLQYNSTNRNSINEYWTNPFLAVCSAIKKIRDEQYNLEKKRIQIIKVNNIMVKTDSFPKKKHWWNKFFKN